MISKTKELDKNNPYFCILPFNHMHIRTDGKVNLCCVADWKNPLSEDITKDDMHNIWTGQKYQQIRKDMLAGHPIQQCNNCYNIEKNGGGSDRQVHNRCNTLFSDDILDIKYGNSKHMPLWVDWRPGRFCNFSCRMCFVGVSSSIAQEHLAYPELETVTGETWYEVNDWIENPIVFKNIISMLPYLKTIKLAGGEPFFMPGVIKLLKYCVENKILNLHLDITTNGSRMQGKVLKWLNLFRSVDIQFSIDGIGYTNDYIRFGANWDDIDKAYKKYLQMPVNTHLLATVQAYNAFDLSNIIQYWKDNGKKGNLIFNFVDSPPSLSIDILPYEHRIEILNNILLKLDGISDLQLEQFRINALIVKLKQNKNIKHSLQKNFANRTLLHDKIRKQTIKKVDERLSVLVEKWKKMN